MKDDIFFDAYKPIRNALQYMDIIDVLCVCWAYSQKLFYPTFKWPRDVEIPHQIMGGQNERWIYLAPWHLEILCREAIILCSQQPIPRYSPKKVSDLFRVIDKIKNFEEVIPLDNLNAENLNKFMFRIGHQQFPWQMNGRMNFEHLYRYYRIFSAPSLDSAIYKKTGLHTHELLLTAVLFLGAYLEHSNITLPLRYEGIEELKTDWGNKFIDLYSSTLDKLSPQIEKARSIDEHFTRQLSLPMITKPLIVVGRNTGSKIYCPLPPFLYWSVTQGLYFLVSREPYFDENAYGKAFEDYIGDVIEKNLASLEKVRYDREQEYFDTTQHKSSDWIIDMDKLIIFVECKTKHITKELKQNPFSGSNNAELNLVAEMIGKQYKSIHLGYINNKYEKFSYNPHKKIQPILVTLDEWMYDMGMRNDTDPLVAEYLKKNGIPLDYLDRFPYIVCSVQTLEKLLQIIPVATEHEFISFLTKKNEGEFIHWQLDTFRQHYFAKHSINFEIKVNLV